MSKRHAEPEIDAFLAIGDYDTIEEWMEDSDYEEDPDGPTGWLYEGEPIWPTDAIVGAMEACHQDDLDELQILDINAEDAATRGDEHTLAGLEAKIALYRTRLGLA